MIKTVLKLDLKHNRTNNSIESVECSTLSVFAKGRYQHEAYLRLLKKTSKSESILKPKSKIYFLKNCTVPRTKMKDFNLENELKVVRDIEKANIIVYSNETITKNINYSWFNKVEVDVLFKYLNYALSHNLISQQNYKKIEEALTEVEYKDKVLVDYSSISFFRDTAVDVTGQHFNYNSSRTDYIENEEIKNIITNPQIYNIIHQDVILAKINSDNVINEEVYKSIGSLLSSRDDANHCVAMEIMANSDYNESCLYLMLLFKEHRNTLYNSKYKNHVNFKSLLNYFSINLSYQIDWDTIINTLKSRKLLTEKPYNYIKKHYMKEVVDYYTSNRRFDFIKIDPKLISFNVEIDKSEELCLSQEM